MITASGVAVLVYTNTYLEVSLIVVPDDERHPYSYVLHPVRKVQVLVSFFSFREQGDVRVCKRARDFELRNKEQFLNATCLIPK